MNLAGTEKLRALIQTSPILSPQEKAEWLALLALMNDKQMGELEKILTSGIKNPELAVENNAKKNQTPPSPASLVTASLPTKDHSGVPQAQIPRLSHIVNLPRITQLTGKPASAPKVGGITPAMRLNATQQISEQSIKAKQNNGFAAKIKAIFSEKELTTSKAEFPLELTDGNKPARVNLPKLNMPVSAPYQAPSKPISLTFPPSPAVSKPFQPNNTPPIITNMPLHGNTAENPPVKIKDSFLTKIKEPLGSKDPEKYLMLG